MREELIAYFKTLSLGTISVTEELPWTKDGEALYLKNYKRIYVDRPTLSQEGVINTLGGASLVNQITTVSAYLVVDAKNQPSNLSAVITSLVGARGEITKAKRLSRTCNLNQTYEGDALVLEFEYSFIELLT